MPEAKTGIGCICLTHVCSCSLYCACACVVIPSIEGKTKFLSLYTKECLHKLDTYMYTNPRAHTRFHIYKQKKSSNRLPLLHAMGKESVLHSVHNEHIETAKGVFYYYYYSLFLRRCCCCFFFKFYSLFRICTVADILVVVFFVAILLRRTSASATKGTRHIGALKKSSIRI